MQAHVILAVQLLLQDAPHLRWVRRILNIDLGLPREGLVDQPTGFPETRLIVGEAHLIMFLGLVVLVYSFRSGAKLIVGQWNWGLRDHLVSFNDIVAALAHESHNHGSLPRGVSDDGQLRDSLELVLL